jgi:hypothetical protein
MCRHRVFVFQCPRIGLGALVGKKECKRVHDYAAHGTSCWVIHPWNGTTQAVEAMAGVTTEPT